MSFIKSAAIGYNEALVLQFAIKKVIPQLEGVVKEASGERLEKAKANLTAAKDMIKDLDEALK